MRRSRIVRLVPNAPLTSPEAGAILGKSARTVQRMADSGDLPYVHKLPGPNGAYLFDRAEVLRVAAKLAEAAAPRAELEATA